MNIKSKRKIKPIGLGPLYLHVLLEWEVIRYLSVAGKNRKANISGRTTIKLQKYKLIWAKNNIINTVVFITKQDSASTSKLDANTEINSLKVETGIWMKYFI